MRENRPYGSEGGEAKSLPYPYHRGSIQIDIELIRPVSADQGQFERGAVGINSGRHAVELEGKALDPGRALSEQFRNRQSPVWRRPFDKQIDRLGVGRDHVDQDGGFALALDVADGRGFGMAEIGRLRPRV